MTKITKKQMFEIVKAGVETGEFAISTDLIVEFCEKEIAALDAKAVKAKERAAAKKAEADVLIGQVEDALTGEYQVIADIAEKVSAVNADATVSKITNRLTKLVEAKIAEKTQVTVPATEGGKSRKLQAYRLAQ